MKLKAILASTALAAILAGPVALAPAAMAQTQPDGAAIAAEPEKVDAFITAALAVSDLRDTYLARLQTESDEDAQVALLEEADAAILQVVEDTPNITIEEYIAIADAAAADPELAARIDARFLEVHDAN